MRPMAAPTEIDFEAEGLLDELEGEAREARLRPARGARRRRCVAGGAARRGRRRAADPAAGRARAGRRRPPLHGARDRRDRRHRPRAAAALQRRPRRSLRRSRRAARDRGRPRGGAADEGVPRRRPAGGRDAAGGADDRDGHGADRRGQPRAGDPHPDPAGRHRARPRPALRRRRRAHDAAGRPDPRPRPAGEHARADPPRRDRHRRPRLRRRSAAPSSSPSASPTWSSSPASARRSPPRSWAWSPAAWRRWRRAVAEPPVRLVKTIGDAVMFVSAEAEPMLDGGAGADRRRRGRRRRVPLLRAGLACGPVLPQSGDYYGRPVNLASRITGVARPGSVVVDAAIKEAAGERLRLHLHRRAPAQGHRLQGEALPRPARAELGTTILRGRVWGRGRGASLPRWAIRLESWRPSEVESEANS